MSYYNTASHYLAVTFTFDAIGLFGTLTYENPSPHPVGSAGPLTAS